MSVVGTIKSKFHCTVFMWKQH